MNKVLTIVVPTYNVEKYLDRCLLSLTYDKSILKELEVIIVNDGSKDNSLAIANEHKKRFPESILVIDKKNGGHGSTINAGLEAATGKYFRVLDSDDWVNIDDFGKFVQELKLVDYDAVLTNFTRELAYDNATDEFRYKDLAYDHEYSLDTLDLALLGDEYIFMHTLTVKTDNLRKAQLKISEHTFYVDMEYIVLPLLSITSFIYLDFDIYHYWIGRPQQSMSPQNMLKNRQHHERVLKRLIDFYLTNKFSKNKKTYIFNIIVLMLNTHYSIYCNQKLPVKTINEIKSFDRWLKKTDRSIYYGVSNKFPQIAYYRNTGFVFSSLLHKKFKQASFFLALRKSQKV